MSVKTYLCAVLAAVAASSTFASSEKGDSFLTLEQTPNSLAYIPEPPTFDSVAFMRDKAAFDAGRMLKGTPRWDEATRDSNLSDAEIAKPFSEAFGIEISPTNTPVTYSIIKKLRTDGVGYATKVAKNHYMRIRPFMFFNTGTCTPDWEEDLRKGGSYPSGHTTFGWATALILAEIRPDRQETILKRGYEYGQSRVICGAHWQSDIDAGRMTGSAEVARLHADPQFMKTLEEAKREIHKKMK